MNKITGDERVYPSNDNGLEKGITLRQYYAGLAMGSFYGVIHSNGTVHGVACRAAGEEQNVDPSIADIEQHVAKWSARMADALIKELNKQQ